MINKSTKAKKPQLVKPKTKKLTVASIVSRTPNNRRRQEPFLPQDAQYLATSPKIKLGKPVGDGFCGEVYFLEGNENLVVKVPKYFAGSHGRTEEQRKREISGKHDEIIDEMRSYMEHDLNNKTMFIPTKIVKMKCSLDGREYPAFVRPVVQVADEYYDDTKPKGQRKLPNAMIEDIRKKVIILSHMGFALNDGLQVGIDKAGRPLIFDAGRIERSKAYNEVFKTNRRAWRNFLYKLGKLDSMEPEAVHACFQKFGDIDAKEHY